MSPQLVWVSWEQMAVGLGFHCCTTVEQVPGEAKVHIFKINYYQRLISDFKKIYTYTKKYSSILKEGTNTGP